MAQGFTSSLPIPLSVARGGTGVANGGLSKVAISDSLFQFQQ